MCIVTLKYFYIPNVASESMAPKEQLGYFLPTKLHSSQLEHTLDTVNISVKLNIYQSN